MGRKPTKKELAEYAREEAVLSLAGEMLEAAEKAAQELYDKKRVELKLNGQEIETLQYVFSDLQHDTRGLCIGWYAQPEPEPKGVVVVRIPRKGQQS